MMVETISIPQDADWAKIVRGKAERTVTRYEGCAQSIVAAFMEELGIEEPMVFRVAGAMQGGMLSSLTCGVHTAGMMVLGLLMGRERLEEGLDGIFPIVAPAQELIRRLNQRLGFSSCRELSGIDFTDMSQTMAFISSGESHKCFALVADGAEEIALFLQDTAKKGDLFRVSKAR